MEKFNIGWLFIVLIGGTVLFVFFGHLFAKALKLVWYLLLQVILGILILFFFNIFGQLINLYLPLNLITTSIVGLLGLPGLATLILIKIFIMPT